MIPQWVPQSGHKIRVPQTFDILTPDWYPAAYHIGTKIWYLTLQAAGYGAGTLLVSWVVTSLWKGYTISPPSSHWPAQSVQMNPCHGHMDLLSCFGGRDRRDRDWNCRRDGKGGIVDSNEVKWAWSGKFWVWDRFFSGIVEFPNMYNYYNYCWLLIPNQL